SLGSYWLDKNDDERAAEHFRQVLLHCRDCPPRNAQLGHDIVRDALEMLYKLHVESQGKIPFVPAATPDAAAPGGGEAVVVVSRLDMSKEETWERLTRMYMTGKAEKPGWSRAAAPRPRAAPVQSDPPERIGRNESCPCGSGKKFKHCCGRAR